MRVGFPQYCEVGIEEFILGKVSPVDVYIRLATDKYVKISNAGEVLSEERLAGYQARNVTHLYLTHEDFARHIGMALPESTKLEGEPARKLHNIKELLEGSLGLVFSNQLNELIYETAVLTVHNVLEMIESNRNLVTLLLELNESGSEGYLCRHGLSVSLISVALARGLGWTSASSLHRLGLGALLHDLGERELDPLIELIPRKSLTRRQLAEYESHPLRGSEILGSLSMVPSDVHDIVLQHHENCLGTGFPGRLPHQRIHPMARIVAVADQFCERVLPATTGTALPPLEAAREVLLSAELDAEVLRVLPKILKH